MAAVGVPVMVGAMVDDPDPEAGLEPGDRVASAHRGGGSGTKWHPVPFGEYIPWRRVFFRTFGRLREVPRDMVAGTHTEPLRAGDLLVADAICYDVAYDSGLHAQLRAGGQVVVVQTSNVMFIHTSQVAQQYAISRLRAIETGRYLAVAAVNGISGVIGPDGTPISRHPVPAPCWRPRWVSSGPAHRPSCWGTGPAAPPSWSSRCGCWAAWPAGSGSGGRAPMSRPARNLCRVTSPDSAAGSWPTRNPQGRTVMVIPTFNEAANLEWIVARLRAAEPEVDVLVVDDGSPDGTGAIADRLAAADPAVHVLHRTEKAGLGAAYLHGFEVALGMGYSVIGEMDADGSHQPEQLGRLLGAIETADLVIGSRYVPGGSVVNWPRSRLLLSRGGNLYVRLLLGMGLTDATAGFRLYRREALEAMQLETVRSAGYVFQGRHGLPGLVGRHAGPRGPDRVHRAGAR